jgi:hypothetical protein
MNCGVQHRRSLLSWRVGPLLAGTLGVATLANPPCIAAQEEPRQDHPDARNEVVVSAARQSDAAITARVSQALHDDPYIFSEHVTVTTENGIMTLAGRVSDLADLHQILRLARRIAGRGRVVNEIEFVPADEDGN